MSGPGGDAVRRSAGGGRPALVPRFAIACALATLALAALAAPAHGQDDFGTTAAIVLRLPVGARPVALGDAYAAVRGDELSLFYNPGALASAAGASGGASYQSWLAASDLVTLGGVIPIGPGALALGVHGLDYGSVEEIVEDPLFGGQTGEPTGREVGASEFVGSIGYGLRPLSALGFGVAAKVVRSEIAGTAGTAVAVDVGARWAVWPERGLSMGASVQNLGSDLELAGRSDPLPRQLRVGAALEVPAAWGAIDGLIVLDLVLPRGGATRLSLGVEADRRLGGLRIAGRAGLHSAAADESLSDPFTVGGGIEVGEFRLDYAYMGFDVLGAAHRVGIRWAASP